MGLIDIMAELCAENRKVTDETAEEMIKRLETRNNFIPSSDSARREYAYVLLKEYRHYIKERPGSSR